MIRLFEKQILDDIDFVNRFVYATNSYVKDINLPFKLTKKNVKDALVETGLHFQNIKDQYSIDLNIEDFTFRLMFDIKGDSILTYIFVLKNNTFLNNGLSNFGFMLNEFDLEGHKINQNFGLNNKSDLLEYLKIMISIFQDFTKVFMLRERPDSV